MLLLLAGGSNLVVADAGFPGTVVRVATRGIERDGDTLHVAAGEPWDALVAHAVAEGLAGIECLSGHPGLGRRDADPERRRLRPGGERHHRVGPRLDRRAETVDLAPADCGFAYRSSAFKRDPERSWSCASRFALHASGDLPPHPLRRAGARARRRGRRDRAAGRRPRRRPGAAPRQGHGPRPRRPRHRQRRLVLHQPDPRRRAVRRAARARRRGVPGFPEPDGRVKTCAAWLIEHAGFAKGYGDPDGIAISTKHVLALTNRGAGTTAELVALAREIARGVDDAFGVALHPEPVFVGHAWDPIPA